jgi:hypothetical protein
MTKDAEKLRAMLGQLHTQLESIDEVDPEVRALLESAVADIHQVIRSEETTATPIPPRDEQESIADRLTHAARHFEESHPTLSGVVGSIIDVLGRMGI